MEANQVHDNIWLCNGEALECLKQLPDSSVDSVVTDPPYELNFMSKGWDNKGIAFSIPLWAECLRVLKPGGYLASFGGTRTYHRMACAIEDAGFEIRDSIGYGHQGGDAEQLPGLLAWVYGSGFPKSLDVSKAIDKALGAEREVVGLHPNPAGNKPGGASLNMSVVGMPATVPATVPSTVEAKKWSGFGTSLKPAWEPIVLARKPLSEKTVAANVLTHGTGAINIDACRVGYEAGGSLASNPSLRTTINGGNGGNIFPTESDRRVVTPNITGRFPANVLLDETAAAELDEQSGTLKSGVMKAGTPHHVPGEIYGADEGKVLSEDTRGDSGGASRFFPVFNSRDGEASAERTYTTEGGTNFAMKPGERRPAAEGPSEFFPVFKYQAKAPKRERPTYWRKSCECEAGVVPCSETDVCETCQAPAKREAHSTVKPLELMRWLIRLVTPPGGFVLDPFAGSGTTGEAAVMEGMNCILIEREEEYLPLIMVRIERATGGAKVEPASESSQSQ